LIVALTPIASHTLNGCGLEHNTMHCHQAIHEEEGEENKEEEKEIE
jgi:hypothetical protein